MASKLENILNTHPSVSRDQLSSSVNSLVSSSQLADIHVTEDEEGGAPERGDPPEGGVGDAPDHSSSTWRLGERGF